MEKEGRKMRSASTAVWHCAMLYVPVPVPIPTLVCRSLSISKLKRYGDPGFVVNMELKVKAKLIVDVKGECDRRM